MNANGDLRSATAENMKTGLDTASLFRLGIPSWNPQIFWYKEIPEHSRMTLESIFKTQKFAIE